MSQPRRPSPAVARRRQILAAVLAVLLLVLVIWGVRGIFGLFDSDDEQAEGQGTQNTPPAEEATGDPTPEAEEAEDDDAAEDSLPEGHCAPGDIEVTASTHQESYLADEAPLLIMEVTNTGSTECTIDVGTAEQTWTITHNGEQIFTTEDCAVETDSLELEFEPGQSEDARFTWPRSDSSVDCTAPAQLPGGDYQLTVSVSGVASEPHTFEVAGDD
ncbi:hypothetical protein [Nesterenkonia alba]|uniref:hypothetical protein n=1 Tax=Nesterenkonia alba TaxID=515814 RepID=UPI00040C16C8|nr:hypothetical protein [Nesterenkonia alba]